MRSGFTPEGIRDLLHRKALATNRHRTAVARHLELSDTEAAAITHLARAGHLTPGQLGELLSLTSGGVTALTHRLHQAGHIVRQPHPRDGRSTVLSAAPEILEQAGALFAPLVTAIDDTTSSLPQEHQEIVGRYLAEIVEVSEKEAEALRSAATEADADLLGVPSPGLWA